MKTFKRSILITALLVLTTQVFGQGEQLFKAKCNTCHMVDRASTGPMLKGVKKKWADAGEAELLYKWVENSKALIGSGQSKMAMAIKDFSPTDMPPQQVSSADVDAILDYVDSYTVEPPKKDTSNVNGGLVPGTTTPDYEENLTIFYWLFGFMVLMIFVILMMANSVTSFVKSDYFQKKLKEQKENGSKLGMILLVVALGSMLVGNNTFALDFISAGETTEKTPWLLVERTDLYLMLAIDLLLVFVVAYLRGLFNTFVQMVVPQKEKVQKVRQKRITKVLTDAVPVEEEKSILMDHEYDGIRELDNNLPPWWVWGFYITIFFAVIYMFHYQFLGTGDSQTAEYNKEVAQAEKDIKAYLDKMAMNVDETNATVLNDKSALESGKAIFKDNCVVCHKADGEGEIGPNLTDKFWIYGNDIKDVFATVKKGRPNGMPEHASKLNPVQIQQVASYVLSLPFKAGKEPQGTEVK